ncbi:MAG TPA: CheR family methyltransferase [Candidatus Sulfotelmatobacter sp.]|jgi:chemotaxis protein methyltransferase CheR|nr:CheR family methyltransferase [Candidatus Sulfotelmatobacter sp.]
MTFDDNQDSLSSHDFARLGTLIEQYSGIRMPPNKRVMVEGRLRHRVRALNLPTLHAYCQHVLDGGALESELPDLIDAITTNKTDFFREIEHFRFLVEHGLDGLMALPHAPGQARPMKLWSAACATGAEPYTLAMLLQDFSRTHRGFDFEIFATDICTQALEKAKNAVYPEEMAAVIPQALAQRYLRYSRQRNTPTVRLIPEIRQSVSFGHLNLMDESYPLPTDMDVIFCRNILIYFKKETQKGVLQKLCHHLRPRGYLFVGHSETITCMDLPLDQVTTAIFMRKP